MIPELVRVWNWKKTGHSIPVDRRPLLATLLGALVLMLAVVAVPTIRLLEIAWAEGEAGSPSLRLASDLPTHALPTIPWSSRVALPTESSASRGLRKRLDEALDALRQGDDSIARANLGRVKTALDQRRSLQSRERLSRAETKAALAIVLARQGECENALWHAKTAVADANRVADRFEADKTQWIYLTLVWLYADCRASYPEAYRVWLLAKDGSEARLELRQQEYANPDDPEIQNLPFRAELSECVRTNSTAPRCWALANLNRRLWTNLDAGPNPTLFATVAWFLAESGQWSDASSFVTRARAASSDDDPTTYGSLATFVDSMRTAADSGVDPDYLNDWIARSAERIATDPNAYADVEASIANVPEAFKASARDWLDTAVRPRLAQVYLDELERTLDQREWGQARSLRDRRAPFLDDAWARQADRRWSAATFSRKAWLALSIVAALIVLWGATWIANTWVIPCGVYLAACYPREYAARARSEKIDEQQLKDQYQSA